jgi:hypothetical protein
LADLNWADVVEITHDQAKQSLLNDLAAQGFTGNSWQEGDPALFGVEVGAEIYRALTKYAVFLRDMALNETATGEALTRLSRSRFGNTRNESVSAQRSITLSCAAGSGPYVINSGDVVLEDAAGEHSIRNVAGLSVVYPANLPTSGTLTLLFEAELPGADSNLGDDSYVSFVTTLAGVTVTDDTPYRIGEDEESDARLRTRNATTIATRSLEPIADTIVNLALEAAPTVYSVAVNDENPRGAGTFDVYLSGELATATGSEVNSVQAALDAKVMGDTTGIPSTRPGQAIAAPTLALNITGTVYYSPTFAAADVEAGVEAALRDFLRTVPLGGFDYTPVLDDVVPKNDIENAIKNATVNGQAGAVRTVSLSTPAADVAVSTYQKVIEGTWTLTYTLATGS